MDTISINYTLKWRFLKYPHLQITTCNKIIVKKFFVSEKLLYLYIIEVNYLKDKIK